MLIFELVKWLRTSTFYHLTPSFSVIISDVYIILTYSNNLYMNVRLYLLILIWYFFYYFILLYPISVFDNCKLYVILRWDDNLCESCRKSIWRDRSEYVYRHDLTKWVSTLPVRYIFLRSFLVRYKHLSVDFIEWFSTVWESLNHWMV